MSAVLDVLRGRAGSPPAELQAIVSLLASICRTRWAAISVLDGDDYHLTVTHGLAPQSCPTSETLCQHTMGHREVMVVRDAGSDPVLAGSPYVDGRLLALRSYASAPLYAPSGEMVGRLCVFDPQPWEPDELQRRALEVLAASVTDVLSLQLGEAPGDDADLRAEQEMARIAAEISHDMRAPLATILGNVELMRDVTRHLDDPDHDDMLERTARAGARLMAMVQQLLEFHRSGAGSLREVDLQEVVSELLADLDGELQEAEAKVVVEPLPCVLGDPYELGSVMLNLLTNALKFARPGVPLEVRIWSTRHGRMERIRVTDNGVGVPEHLQRRVFEMFGRADDRVEGHGIGLATARRIVRGLGGDIGLVSDGHTGTEVWCDLLAAPPLPERSPSPPGG